MSAPKLGKDVFVALAAVAWSDGQLDPDEADAIIRTAADEGLSLGEMAEIEEATKNPVDLGVVDRGAMSKEDRLFVYAVACWIARMDRHVTDTERAALASLGERLGIPELPRQHADAIVREFADMPEGDRPARYDLAGVRRSIGERLRRGHGAPDGGSHGKDPRSGPA